MNDIDWLVNQIWLKLLERCAGHKPSEYHKVKRVIMVSKDDIRAIITPFTIFQLNSNGE